VDAYYLPGIVLDTTNTSVSKTGKKIDIVYLVLSEYFVKNLSKSYNVQINIFRLKVLKLYSFGSKQRNLENNTIFIHAPRTQSKQMFIFFIFFLTPLLGNKTGTAKGMNALIPFTFFTQS